MKLQYKTATNKIMFGDSLEEDWWANKFEGNTWVSSSHEHK
jgi:hypothetical protein